MFTAFMCLLFFQDRQTLFLQPIDFSDEDAVDAYPNYVDQIESVGEKIYLRSKKTPYVTIMDRKGKILGKIGKQGFGPGEIDTGVLAMGVFEEHIWLMGIGKWDRLLHFRSGEFVEEMKVTSMNLGLLGSNSDTFAVSPDAVVWPCSPRTGHLAMALNPKGLAVPLGEIVFDKRNIDLLRKAPEMNDTNWLFDGKYYFGVFRYYPMVLKFNRKFKQVATFPIDLPYVQDAFSRQILEWEPGQIKRALPVFFDAKVRFGNLFLMTEMALVRMDTGNGKVKALYQFKGKGQDFAEAKVEGDLLSLPQFTVLDDGTLILSGIFMWGHDLWSAKLPKPLGRPKKGLIEP